MLLQHLVRQYDGDGFGDIVYSQFGEYGFSVFLDSIFGFAYIPGYHFNAHALDGVCHYYFFHIGQFHVRGVFPFLVFIYPHFPLVFVSCDQCVFLGDVSREKYAHDVSGFSVGICNERDEFMVYGDFQRLVFS